MFVDKVREYILDKEMIQKKDHIIVGVSGGADSLCLLYVLHSLSEEFEISLTAVHVHHGIRGEEADRDMRHTVNMCDAIGVECKVFHYNIPELAGENGATEEEMGRIVRYRTFSQVVKDIGADKIAVAHNMGDNCETILFNMCRGSNLKGIGGISPVQDNIIRPLLCVGRDEIETYMEENGIQYIVDSSNLKNDYMRNKIRNILIPFLTENINPRAVEHIIVAGEAAGEADEYLEKLVEEKWDKYLLYDGKKAVLDEKLMGEHPVIRKRIIRQAIGKVAGRLKDISAVHIKSVEDLFSMQVSKQVSLPYNMIAVRCYNGISVERKRMQEKSPCQIINVSKDNIYKLNDGRIIRLKKIKKLEKNFKIEEKIYTKWIDCDKIENTLQIRTRLPGDYLIVDNAGSSKKLKEYFINEKIPKEDRDSILLLADGHHIIWIFGYRISEYYKVSDSTENVLEIIIQSE